ncbi:MAG: hypothetical protein CL695_03815 [Chloroflexi bacterium]|nr:hypothetical protein [Chloroflexota bacterium]
MSVNIHVVFDFDGTLATTFVGGEMFRCCTSPNRVAELSGHFSAGEISLRQYQESVFDMVDETTFEMSKRAALHGCIRKRTTEVCELVWDSGGVVSVASAGLNFYIEPVLEKAGLDRIELHSGKVLSEPGERPPFRYDYPSYVKSCRGDWVTCKCEVINRLKNNYGGSEVIFVGDGLLGDACAAVNAADTVFATGKLLRYCEKSKIPAIEFGKDFGPLLRYVHAKTFITGAS